MADEQGGLDAGALTGDPAAAAGGGAAPPAAEPAAVIEAQDGPFTMPDWAKELPTTKPDDKTLSDAEWLANKRYATPADLVKQTRTLETMLGSDKLPLPKSPEDKAGWDAVWEKLGRPADPKGYELPLPEGQTDRSFADAFAGKAHELGMPKAMAEGAVKWWNGAVAEQVKAHEAATLEAHRGEVKALASELGDEKYTQTLETALRAATRFGFSGDELAQLRGAMGPKALITRFAAIGAAMGEDGLIGGGERDMGMTAEKAAARKAEIMIDKDFQGRLTRKDPTALAEWAEINRVEGEELRRQQAA